MKSESLISSIIAISIAFPAPVRAAAFSRIYSFGDSLSDTGNINQVVLQATGGTQTFPPSPPYNNGRFSNGKIWVELLAERFKVPLVDLAFGGATTGTQNTLDRTLAGLPLPGLQQQIANFTINNPVADSNALYTVWIGANDYLPTDSLGFFPYNTPDTSILNIQAAINQLIGVGAKQIMVLNLPNLGEIPVKNGSLDGVCPVGNQFDADCLNQLTQAHNMELEKLSSLVPPNINIIPVDINTLVQNAVQNPAQFSLTNATDPCLIFTSSTTFTLCSNPDHYLFWDERHPSFPGHTLIADVAFESLGIPEPRAIAGLVMVGIMVLGKSLNRKNQN